MREIKFRAWDGHKMYAAFDLSQNPKYWWEKLQDYPLMQYTGLKDKNGVEIYEGDIVSVPYGKFVYEDNDKILDFIPCAIEQNRQGWFAKPLLGKKALEKRQGKRQQMFFEHTDEVELLGNIYENKELLDENR